MKKLSILLFVALLLINISLPTVWADDSTTITNEKLLEVATHLAQLDAAPSGWPLKGTVTSTFGEREKVIVETDKPVTNKPEADQSVTDKAEAEKVTPATPEKEFHNGVDIGVAEGTQVYATAAGVVEYAGDQRSGYGNVIFIKHEGGFTTIYGHNSKLLVTVGQNVAAGELIALSGNSGLSTGPHLHYEIRYNGEPVNPQPFLDKDPARIELFDQFPRFSSHPLPF